MRVSAERPWGFLVWSTRLFREGKDERCSVCGCPGNTARRRPGPSERMAAMAKIPLGRNCGHWGHLRTRHLAEKALLDAFHRGELREPQARVALSGVAPGL